MGAGTTRFAEHVYLGDIPIAVIKEAVATPEIHYVYADQINRPWSVTDTANQLRWRWETEPFGSSVEERDPAGLGDFAYNLRFPGQYYDQITRTHYNYFRDYSPEIGRYVESDPIGLAGGSNTYGYVEGNPLSHTDPEGLLAQGIVDFGAGMGDVILFGQGQRLRDLLGVDGGIDRCTAEYSAGEWAGVAAGMATGLTGGLKAAGAKGAGKEFSHWIPNRMGGPRSTWNGNYVPTATHALSDPYRYRFMPRTWKAQNPMPNVASQQWTRIPSVYKGGAAGTAYGAAGAAQAGCSCER